MANELTYQSEFTGSQMDERFRAVATLAEALTVLEQAIAAKYTKPADGIPSTDMDASVQSALALALTSVQSLADYYTKSEVDSIAAAIAATINATSGEVVASLPTASASTLGKIYYVGPTSGEYDRYVTSYDGTTYSWLQIGSTDVDMTQYATKAELSQLDQKVGETETIQERVDFAVAEWTGASVVNSSDGTVVGLTNYKASSAIDVSGCAGNKMHYARMQVTAASPTYDFGMAFYDANGDYISGEIAIGSQADFGYTDSEITVPANAKTAKFTCRTTFIDDFYAYGFLNEETYTNGLGKRVQDIEESYAYSQGLEGVDLAISDGNGHDIARFKGGDFLVKNFDSSFIGSVIGRYKGKRISILGDSISTFGTPSADNEDGDYCYSYYPAASCRYSEDGVDSIEFDVENTYWMKLIRQAQMELGINDSYRGTKVSGTTDAFNLQARINHLGENGTPNVILVFGGANDAGAGVTIGTFNTEDPSGYTDAQIAALPVTTFADAYRTMLIRLMKTYPLAEIVVILPTFTSSYYTITNLDLYVEVIKEACDFFGIKYIDARCSGINIYNKSSYLVDGIHPNAAGMDLLFKQVYKQLIFD